MPKKYELTEFQKDTLRETAHIGFGRASTALSKLAGEEIKLIRPSIDLVSTKEIPKLVRGRKKLVVGAFTRISGDVSGALVVMFSKKSALSLISLLQDRKKPSRTLSDEDKAVFQEVSNILSGSYLKALNEFLGLKLIHSLPRVVSTFGESVIDLVLLGIEERMKESLLIQTNFVVEKRGIEGYFVVIMAMESAISILRAALLQIIKKRAKEENLSLADLGVFE